jgi:hypothetical protein
LIIIIDKDYRIWLCDAWLSEMLFFYLEKKKKKGDPTERGVVGVIC